ncbi:MAG: hypothetical protein RLY86_439 [Pseudomonadota bacterium]|jgi:hypothetical protein
MVTVHRAFGYRFVVFPNDHAPPHVHALGQGGEAKVVLGDPDKPVVEWTVGIPRGDLRRILDEVRRRHPTLLAAWERVHGR